MSGNVLGSNQLPHNSRLLTRQSTEGNIVVLLRFYQFLEANYVMDAYHGPFFAISNMPISPLGNVIDFWWFLKLFTRLGHSL